MTDPHASGAPTLRRGSDKQIRKIIVDALRESRRFRYNTLDTATEILDRLADAELLAPTNGPLAVEYPVPGAVASRRAVADGIVAELNGNGTVRRVWIQFQELDRTEYPEE